MPDLIVESALEDAVSALYRIKPEYSADDPAIADICVQFLKAYLAALPAPSQDTEVLDPAVWVAAQISTMPEFSHVESPLILRICDEALKLAKEVK